MLITDLFEASERPHEVYHWCDAEALRKILDSDTLEAGIVPHSLGGQKLHGVSVSRNPYFDISQTYAISGRRSWRIGLDYLKLRTRYRVLPIRDERYRHIPRNKRFDNPYRGRESSDEYEELVLGEIVPLARYMTSLAVEDRWIDLTLHPIDAQDNGFESDPEPQDQVLLFDILADRHPELLDYHEGRRIQWNHVPLEDHIPLLVIEREGPRIRSIEAAWGPAMKRY